MKTYKSNNELIRLSEDWLVSDQGELKLPESGTVEFRVTNTDTISIDGEVTHDSKRRLDIEINNSYYGYAVQVGNELLEGSLEISDLDPSKVYDVRLHISKAEGTINTFGLVEGDEPDEELEEEPPNEPEDGEENPPEEETELDGEEGGVEEEAGEDVEPEEPPEQEEEQEESPNEGEEEEPEEPGEEELPEPEEPEEEEVTPEPETFYVLKLVAVSDKGRLLHPTLEEVYDIRDLEKSKCIRCHYSILTGETIGQASRLGEESGELLKKSDIGNPNGDFFLIHTGYGTEEELLLTADREVHSSISFKDILNLSYDAGVEAFEMKIDDTHDNVKVEGKKIEIIGSKDEVGALVVSNHPKRKGKFYFEVHIGNRQDTIGIGICKSGANLNDIDMSKLSDYRFIYSGIYGTRLMGGSEVYGEELIRVSDGNVVSVLLDLDGGKMYYKTNNTNMVHHFEDLGELGSVVPMIIMDMNEKGTEITLRTDKSEFSYPLPEGYVPFNVDLYKADNIISTVGRYASHIEEYRNKLSTLQGMRYFTSSRTTVDHEDMVLIKDMSDPDYEEYVSVESLNDKVGFRPMIAMSLNYMEGMRAIRPEFEWARYDDRDPHITYSNKLDIDDELSYKGTLSKVSSTNNIRFNFKGTGIRIIGRPQSDGDKTSSIIIDDAHHVFSSADDFDYDSEVILLDVNKLSNEEHTVFIQGRGLGEYIYLDAIDISPGGEIRDFYCDTEFILVEDSENIKTLEVEGSGWVSHLLGQEISELDFRAYGYTDISEIVESDWASLQSPKLHVWRSDGYKPKLLVKTVAHSLANEIEATKVLVNSTASNKLQVEAIPQDEIVLQTKDIPTKYVEEILGVKVLADNTEKIRVIFSTDSGHSWYTHNNGNVEVINPNNILDIRNRGMSLELVESLGNEWTNIIDNRVRLGFLLSTETVADNPKIADVEVSVMLSPRWKSAVHGRDYDYEYDHETIYLSLYQSGEYKVNYN